MKEDDRLKVFGPTNKLTSSMLENDIDSLSNILPGQGRQHVSLGRSLRMKPDHRRFKPRLNVAAKFAISYIIHLQRIMPFQIG